MLATNRLATVRVSRTVACPPDCRWHGTEVLHARHEEQVDAEVVTLEEACRRLGVSPKFRWEGQKDAQVAFNDRVCQNYSVGQSKAVHSFQSVYQTKWGGFMLSATAYVVAEAPSGELEVCVPG